MSKIDPNEIFINKEISLKSLMRLNDYIDYSIIKRDDIIYLLFYEYDDMIDWEYIKSDLEMQYPVKWQLTDDGLNYCYEIIDYGNENRLKIYEYDEYMNTKNVFSFSKSDYGMVKNFVKDFKYWIENQFFVYNLYVIKDKQIIDEYHISQIANFDQLYDMDINIDIDILKQLKEGF